MRILVINSESNYSNCEKAINVGADLI